MTTIGSFFHGLRGRLILTYTLVTVLALLALEIFILAAVLMFNTLMQSDKRGYLSDVVYQLGPQASKYLQPGQENLPGLQSWLDQLRVSGYASLPASTVFDNPAAAIVQSQPIVVLSADRKVLAESPRPSATAPGSAQVVSQFPGSDPLIQRALNGSYDPMRLVTTTRDGNFLLAVPVAPSSARSDVLGVILLTVRPNPSKLAQTVPTLVGWVLGTGIFLLIAVAPFAALFGLIMSRGLTRRLNALTAAADTWSEGDFRPLPTDRSNDEIGYLSMRMRNMAERIQALLHTQQQLAMIEERNRLARELHDTVKQQTFATLMQVRAARNLIESDPNAARQRLEEAEQLIKTSQQELGLIISELRPAALDGQGLAGALREYVDTWSQYTRIPAAINILNERALPLETEQALYRVAQEALSNVARHSSASAVTVRLAYEAESICLSTIDNGVGFDPAAAPDTGYGLQTMRERLYALGGSLFIDSTPGSGTQLTATVPIKKEGAPAS